MARGIFAIRPDKSLVRMDEQPYDTEDLLQKLLVQYPDILAGDQMNGDAPRRWLLVRREMGVPDSDGGLDRWSLDHLFLDQEGVPTLIEVKRATDNRIRREVAGQMLDYAANAVVHWPLETIRAAYSARCEADAFDEDEELAEFLEGEMEPQEFRQRVKTNLQAGRIRMVFVADEIPRELRRIVEFLNAQMDPAEVLAVEIRQYVGEGVSSLVPTVIGLTAEAERKRAVGPQDEFQWNEQTFFEAVSATCRPEVVSLIRGIYDWALKNDVRVWWRKGRTMPSFVPISHLHGVKNQLCNVYAYRMGVAYLDTYFQHLGVKPPFKDEQLRHELRERFNRIPSVSIAPDQIRRRPSISLDAVAQNDAVNTLIEVLDWELDQIKTMKA